MPICDVCGNDYDKAFEVHAQGTSHTFDSFECAIQALAPICDHCEVSCDRTRVESNGRIFCCAHCAGEEGITDLRDRK